jgi:hypothetical protein
MQLVQITQSLREGMTTGERTQVNALVDEFGSRAFGPFLILPAIVEISPLGAIPGVPTALAVFIALVSFQLLVGCDRLWLPHLITRYQLDNDRVLPALEKIEPIMIRMDHWFSGKQLTLFTRKPFTRIAALCCIALAVSVPPLELFPFASSAPLLTVALIGSALLLDDGRLMLCAALFSALSLFGTGFAVSKLDVL